MRSYNSIPQNLIELYYPPAALSYAVPITNAAKRQGENLKQEWKSHRLPGKGNDPGRLRVLGRHLFVRTVLLQAGYSCDPNAIR